MERDAADRSGGNGSGPARARDKSRFHASFGDFFNMSDYSMLESLEEGPLFTTDAYFPELWIFYVI
ncbi:MAG: hypothetical protein C0622_08820 [Desulfuromonas sp.]|nr:MAG: hypothetical protein C0622_08820 [Desulfuromonas sp.]